MQDGKLNTRANMRGFSSRIPTSQSIPSQLIKCWTMIFHVLQKQIRIASVFSKLLNTFYLSSGGPVVAGPDNNPVKYCNRPIVMCYSSRLTTTPAAMYSY